MSSVGNFRGALGDRQFPRLKIFMGYCSEFTEEIICRNVGSEHFPLFYRYMHPSIVANRSAKNLIHNTTGCGE